MMIWVETKGRYDFIDITDKIVSVVRESDIENGAVLIFVSHTTAALTIMEYEDGTIRDLIDIFEKMAPEAGDYKHQLNWNDKNGAAHIKSALVGQDLYVPIVGGEINLGKWQRIVLIDFDEKPRTRKLVVQIMGSTVNVALRGRMYEIIKEEFRIFIAKFTRPNFAEPRT